jgi:hypothetical protein
MKRLIVPLASAGVLAATSTAALPPASAVGKENSATPHAPRCRFWLRRLTVGIGLTSLVLALGALPASAHPHPERPNDGMRELEADHDR